MVDYEMLADQLLVNLRLRRQRFSFRERAAVDDLCFLKAIIAFFAMNKKRWDAFRFLTSSQGYVLAELRFAFTIRSAKETLRAIEELTQEEREEGRFWQEPGTRRGLKEEIVSLRNHSVIGVIVSSLHAHRDRYGQFFGKDAEDLAGHLDEIYVAYLALALSRDAALHRRFIECVSSCDREGTC